MKQMDSKVFCSPKSAQSFNSSFLLWPCKALFQSQLHGIYFELLPSKPVPCFVCLPASDQTLTDPCGHGSWIPSFLAATTAPVLESVPHSDLPHLTQLSGVSLIPHWIRLFPLICPFFSLGLRNRSDFTLCSLIPPLVPKLPLTDCPAMVTLPIGCASTLSPLC